jgi:hypothetical protein
VSPVLQQAAVDLQRRQLSDSLTHHLAARPTSEELRDRGILRGLFWWFLAFGLIALT